MAAEKDLSDDKYERLDTCDIDKDPEFNLCCGIKQRKNKLMKNMNCYLVFLMFLEFLLV